MDIAPTATVYEPTNREFATRYFWWFFLIQSEPLPERMIAGQVELYLCTHLKQQTGTPGVPEEPVLQEYLRCLGDLAFIHAICEDYRAAATIDLDDDAADVQAGRRLAPPLLGLWGSRGPVGNLYDVTATGRRSARVGGLERNLTAAIGYRKSDPSTRSVPSRTFRTCMTSRDFIPCELTSRARDM